MPRRGQGRNHPARRRPSKLGSAQHRTRRPRGGVRGRQGMTIPSSPGFGGGAVGTAAYYENLIFQHFGVQVTITQSMLSRILSMANQYNNRTGLAAAQAAINSGNADTAVNIFTSRVGAGNERDWIDWIGWLIIIIYLIMGFTND